MQHSLDLSVIDDFFKEFSEQKVVSLDPSENDPDLIFNVIFCVHADRTPDLLAIIWPIILQYLRDFKIKVSGVSLNFCFKLDLAIANLCMFVDYFFNNEKQIVTIILSLEMSPLKQPRVIVFCDSSFLYEFISFFFYVNTVFAFNGFKNVFVFVLYIKVSLAWLLSPK